MRSSVDSAWRPRSPPNPGAAARAEGLDDTRTLQRFGIDGVQHSSGTKGSGIATYSKHVKRWRRALGDTR